MSDASATGGADGPAPSIGYYAHHHGYGHRARAAALTSAYPGPSTVLTSATFAAPDVEVVRLPLDLPTDGRPATEATEAIEPLHWTPLGVAGLRERSAAVAGWIAHRRPALVVVDVSVEMTLLVRLLATAPVVVRQTGRRDDRAHRLAYDAAVALVAPFDRRLEDPDAPDELVARTTYVGGLHRFAGRPRAPRRDPTPTVVVMAGGGGLPGLTRDLPAAARATPGWRWRVVGADPAARSDVRRVPDNLEVLGWTDDVWPVLSTADVAVTAAGHNAVTEVAAAGAALICHPEPRPFDEQVARARRLESLGAATVLTTPPRPAAWRRLLEEAAGREDAPLRGLADEDAAGRAADLLTELAERYADDRIRAGRCRPAPALTPARGRGAPARSTARGPRPGD